MRFGKCAHCYRQGTYMVVMTVRDGDSLHLLVPNEVIKRETLVPFPFRVNSRIEQNAVSVDLDKPACGSNIVPRIEIYDPHGPKIRVFCPGFEEK